MEITLEEIQKKFESLPENLKWAIMAANVDDNLIEIGREQNLNVEQLGQLSLETHMEMFGFTHPDKFEESIKNSLKLPDKKIWAIVEAINEKILKGIRAKLGEKNDDEVEIPKPPVKTDTVDSVTSRQYITPQNTVEEKKNTQILSAHGIEIIPEKLELNEKEKIHSILTQKLSSPVQIPSVKTEHSLENLTKVSSIPTIPKAPIPMAPSSVMGTIKPTSSGASNLSPSYSIKNDPYREIPN
jgi:hypothetical protein